MKNTGKPKAPATPDPEAAFVLDTGEETVDDGWQITGAYAVTDRGVVITRLCIEPSPYVNDSGESRPRLAHEIPLRGIDTRVLGLIKLRRLRSEIWSRMQVTAKLAGLEEHLPHLRNTIDTAKAQVAKLEAAQPTAVGRKPADPSRMAAFAEEYLEERNAPEPNYRARLADRWSMGIEGVDSRKKLLRRKGWIRTSGQVATPGPLLDQWRIAHKTDGGD